MAGSLREIADLLEIGGEKSFKVQAYRRAARAVERLPADLGELAAGDRLLEIPGVGPALAGKIAEILETGSCRYLEDLRQGLPEGILELLEIPDLGPRTVAVIYARLGISTIAGLEAAARQGRLRGLPGLGEKKEQAILENIARWRRRDGRILLVEALAVAGPLISELKAVPGVREVAAAGDVRRRCETVAELELVVGAANPRAARGAVAGLPALKVLAGLGEPGLVSGEEFKVSFRVAVDGRRNLEVTLSVLDLTQYPLALQWCTGSPAHNERLRERARGLGLRMGKDELLDSHGRPMEVRAEADLYAALGLEWIPPELREGAGEVEAAAAGTLPKLLAAGEIKGDLHTHSQWSDGHDSIASMAQAAAGQGYQYLAVSDHSRSLTVARGLDPERLALQWREIEALNARQDGCRILKGIEVDILPDGTLDYPDELLSRFDIVTASVHSRMRMDRETMTARILRAMENPHVDVIGHLTGRILGRREPYDVDLDRVLETAQRTGTALEINASPDRLDLRDVHARLAGERDLLVVINTDAHSIGNMGDIIFGVWVARRAWLEKRQVLNTFDLDQLLAWLGRGS